ncbi:MAG: hypothetical protein ACKVUT_16400 [Gaiella sp.]
MRLGALAVVLLLALAVSKGCASEGRNISSERAMEVARASITFTPDRTQVRFVQQGIPPRPLWAVSLYTTKAGRPDRVVVVLVDADTGKIVRSTR